MERLEQMRAEQKRDELRDRFFPRWHFFGPSTPRDLQPLYNVVCDTWEAYLDAERVKPKYVKAKITYKPGNNKAA